MSVGTQGCEGEVGYITMPDSVVPGTLHVVCLGEFG